MYNASKVYELNILVSGRPISEYEHQGNIFVEGRKGSEFEVEFKNKTGKQVLVVPSVDGKSVFDGKPATPESKGYIVRPWGSIRVPGWTLDQSNVAKFTFEDKEKSYSAAMAQEGEAVVSGVIGVLVYSEVEKPAPVHINHHHHHYPKGPSVPRTPYPGQPWPYNGPMWTMDNMAVGGTAGMESDSVVKSVLRSRGAVVQNSATLSASASVSNPAPLENPFEMGAGFGDKSSFATQTVAFERGPVLATMSLYYDSRRNLEKRGIEVAKKETRHLNELPQAFAGTGCTPPPGWNG